MTKGRDNAAERLNDVVAIIRARRQNGVLSVERFEDGRFEEGEIYFENGQPIQAHLGALSAQDALERLLNWRSVYFLFVKDVSTEPQNAQARTTGSMTPVPPSSQPRLPLPSGRSNGADYALTQQPTVRQDAIQRTPRDVMNNGELMARVPRRVNIVKDVLSLPLTRTQRSLYLLVDGKRNLGDLARCTQKNIQEVYWLLSELRNRGYIAF